MNETDRNELEQIKEIIRNTVDPEGIYLFGSSLTGNRGRTATTTFTLSSRTAAPGL